MTDMDAHDGPALVWRELHRLGMMKGDVETRRLALTVKCPWCKAEPGFGCVLPNGWRLEQAPAHPTRVDLARDGTLPRSSSLPNG